MNFRSYILFVVIFGVFVSLSSCVKDSDYSSTESRIPTQTIDSDLIIATIEASDFINGIEQKEAIVYTDTMRLEAMDSWFYLGQMTKSQLTFKFMNTSDVDFKVDFEFLNEDHMIMHNVQVPVSAGSIDAPMAVEATVIIKEPELVTFKEASKLVYKITLPANKKHFNSDTKGKISILSKATYFFDN